MTILATMPWRARLGGILSGVALAGFATVQYAAADSPTRLSQTPPALAWIDLRDSRGISIWNYELSIDRGGVLAPDKFYWATVTDFAWGVYRGGCALALWFIDWVMSLTWVKVIAAPLLAVEGAFQQVVDRLGLVPTFLTITALIAGILMLRGKHSGAIWEIAMACLIAALASGAFAHPVQLVAGDDGAVVRAGKLGQEIAAGVATGDSAGKSPAQLRKEQTGQLVDTFIRQPTEMINFGEVIDGTKCEGPYTEALKAGPYGLEDDIRQKVGDCSDSLGEYAESPSASMALGSMMIVPASAAVFFMALALAGSVMAAAVLAMVQSVKAIITLVTGLLPGGGRGSLMLSVAEVLVSLVVMVGTSVFLSIFLMVIQAMFASAGGGDVAKTFVIVDVLLVVGTVVFLRWRRQILALGRRLAEAAARGPSSRASRIPDRSGRSLGSRVAGAAAGVVRTGIGLEQLRTQRAIARRAPGGAPSIVDNRQQSVIVIGASGSPAGSSGPTWVQSPSSPGGFPPSAGGQPQMPNGSNGGRPQLPGGGDPMAGGRPQLPGGGDPTAGGRPQLPPHPGGSPKSLPGGAKKAAGVLASAGTHAALAAASGGTSAVAAKTVKAAQAARAARRASVMARMAVADPTKPPQPHSSTPVPTGAGAHVRPPTTSPTAGRGPATNEAAAVVIPGEVVDAPPPPSPQPPPKRRGLWARIGIRRRVISPRQAQRPPGTSTQKRRD